MSTGEVRDVPENVAAPFLDCGYLEAVDPPAPALEPEPKKKQDKEET